MDAKPYEPAFPNYSHADGEGSCFQPGLTKREYFAAIALQGFAANPHSGIHSDRELATFAVSLADELIKALNKSEEAA